MSNWYNFPIKKTILSNSQDSRVFHPILLEAVGGLHARDRIHLDDLWNVLGYHQFQATTRRTTSRCSALTLTVSPKVQAKQQQVRDRPHCWPAPRHWPSSRPKPTTPSASAGGQPKCLAGPGRGIRQASGHRPEVRAAVGVPYSPI